MPDAHREHVQPISGTDTILTAEMKNLSVLTHAATSRHSSQIWKTSRVSFQIFLHQTMKNYSMITQPHHMTKM